MNIPERPKLVLTQEQIEKMFLTTLDSVKLINFLNSKEEKTQEDLDTIERNKEHIQGVLSREEIKNDSRDKSIFLEALS
jgi:hypothetical protein